MNSGRNAWTVTNRAATVRERKERFSKKSLPRSVGDNMTSKLLSPGLRIIITLLLVALCFGVYWYFTPSYVRDELLSQIEPRMTVEAAESILGSSWPDNDVRIWGPSTAHGGFILEDYQRKWSWESRRLRMIAILPNGASAPPLTKELQFNFWISDKQRLLWVESKDGFIVHVWSIPLKSTVH